MTNDERKLATSSLIPLDIDPVSILSLSKGVIFDTVVHNIEFTLNNQRTDPLPWKLIGMSLICDPNRNKKYMQKLQKMQCVPSVISTQIYHSKLIKTDAGILATPGKKITLATSPPKRLTGIIVCRSIDELLFMESSNTEQVHFIQYKLLSYERIASRELVNGPKLSSVYGKVIKTVFDFELTQNNGFPRQLLPVAIISFRREDGCDLVLSIRNFLKLDEHKTFDKSYLVTSINVDHDRLREEQERKEETEIENEIAQEKLQRRQPLADLSRKTIDTGNAAPPTASPPGQRVPPLKIKIPRPDKPAKTPTSAAAIISLDKRYQCLLKLDRIDLSMYDISNLPISPPLIPSRESVELPGKEKTKSLTITKPYEHSKPLKRLNKIENKKSSTAPSAESSKEKSSNNSMLVQPLTIAIPPSLSSAEDRIKQRSISASSMSPIYRSRTSNKKSTIKKTETKKKVQRPALPPAYQCSLLLTPIDLSLYNIDPPPMITTVNSMPMDVESTTKLSSSSNSNESDQNPDMTNTLIQEMILLPSSITTIEEETMAEPAEVNNMQVQSSSEINPRELLPRIVKEIGTPDLNGPESHSENDIFASPTNEPIPMTIDEFQSIPTNETVLEILNEMITKVMNDIKKPLPSVSSSPCIAFSPDLPPLDDDPVLLSLETAQVQPTNDPNIIPQDYIIIVPCSDDEDDDDFDDYPNNNQKQSDTKTIDLPSPPHQHNPSSTLIHPSLTRVRENCTRLSSHRLSTSSSSSCSSISTSIIHNQSPRAPLSLTLISLPPKILRKIQHKSMNSIVFSRFDLNIPFQPHESLIDPRLKYRLQPITPDSTSTICCTQCSISAHLPSLFASSTQTILYDRRHPFDFVDPRRDSLKNAILYHIYERIKLLIPNIFILNSNQFQKLLFEQTIFKSNCSLHLEYLLHQLKQSDDLTFFHMIKSNEEFQLSSLVIQLISHT